MLNVNRPPTFAPISGRVIQVGSTFEFDLSGSDPDAGATLTYSALSLPTGATLNAQSGRFRWTPLAVQTGEQQILFEVSDGELNARATLPLIVSAELIPPAVRVELTPSFPIALGQSVLIHATASSVADIASLQITVAGQSVTLDAFGRATFRPTTAGHIAIVATATDVDGNVGTESGDLKVRDPSDEEAPIVQIALPVNQAILTSPTSVIGSIQDGNLDEFSLALSTPGSEKNHSDFGTNATQGTLAEIDPNRLANALTF